MKIIGLLIAVLVAVLAIQAQAAAPSSKKVAAAAAAPIVDGPNDVHLHVVGVAHSNARSADTLVGIENKFADSHARVVDRLNKVLRRVSKTVDSNRVVEFLETKAAAETEGIVLPILDDTGSHAHLPKANLTRFKVKAAIDEGLILDAKLIKKELQPSNTTVVPAVIPSNTTTSSNSTITPTPAPTPVPAPAAPVAPVVPAPAAPVVAPVVVPATPAPAVVTPVVPAAPVVTPVVPAPAAPVAPVVPVVPAPVVVPAAPVAPVVPVAPVAPISPALTKAAFLELYAELDAEADGDAESETEMYSEADAQMYADAEAEFAAGAEAEADAGADVEAEVDADAEFEAAASQEMDAELAAQQEAEFQAGLEAHLASEADAEVVVEQDTQAEFEQEMEVEDAAAIEVAPIVDETGSHHHLPKANLTRFKVKAAIDEKLVLDDKLAKRHTSPIIISSVPAGYVVPAVAPAPVVPAVFIEQEGIVIPILDDTGSHSHLPKANLTRFKIKPIIDESLILDAKLIKKELQPSNTTVVPAVIPSNSTTPSNSTVAPTPAPVVPVTPVAPVVPAPAAPVAPVVPAPVVPAAPVAPVVPVAPVAPVVPVVPAVVSAPIPVSVAPAVPKSLLQVRGDCVGCKTRGLKQDLRIVLSPVQAPSAADQESNAELHRRVDYLIEPQAQKMSITEQHLANGRLAALNAKEAHERFAEFVDQQADVPLIPRI